MESENNLIGKYVAVVKLNDGLGYIINDYKYLSQVIFKVVKIVHQVKHNLYITDYFVPELIDVKNDYVHYGFLILSRENFKRIENE